ncbi:MAG: transposase [Candidatus Binatia bacterium]
MVHPFPVAHSYRYPGWHCKRLDPASRTRPSLPLCQDRCRIRKKRKQGARERDKQVSQQRSEEFRNAAVVKFHSRGGRTVEEVARSLGVSSWSLYQWSKLYGKAEGMKNHRRRAE